MFFLLVQAALIAIVVYVAKDVLVGVGKSIGWTWVHARMFFAARKARKEQVAVENAAAEKE
jgi:hypothetical protein